MNQNRGFEHGQLEKKRFFHTWNVGTTPSRCTSILDQPMMSCLGHDSETAGRAIDIQGKVQELFIMVY